MQGRYSTVMRQKDTAMTQARRAHAGMVGLTAALLLFLTLASGCSWTSSLFGSGDDPEKGPQTTQKQEGDEARQPAAQEDAPPAQTEQKPLSAEQRKASEGLVPRPERSKSPADSQADSQGTEAQQTAEKQEMTPEETPAKTPETPEAAETPEEESSRQAPDEVAALQEPQTAESEEPEEPVKAKGVVPIEPSVKSRMETPAPASAAQEKVYYKTTQDLHEAIQKAINSEKFLGYTDPFDAFPVLDGVDTMSAAFIPVDHPDFKIFYHAFFQPTKPFHKRVYGYTVINMKTNKDYGYFDGNADGVFEQETLDPKIVLDDYIKASESEGQQTPSGE